MCHLLSLRLIAAPGNTILDAYQESVESYGVMGVQSSSFW